MVAVGRHTGPSYPYEYNAVTERSHRPGRHLVVSTTKRLEVFGGGGVVTLVDTAAVAASGVSVCLHFRTVRHRVVSGDADAMKFRFLSCSTAKSKHLSVGT